MISMGLYDTYFWNTTNFQLIKKLFTGLNFTI